MGLVSHQRRVDTEVITQPPRDPCVLTGDPVYFPHDTDRTKGHILEVTDRRRDNVERAFLEFSAYDGSSTWTVKPNVRRASA